MKKIIYLFMTFLLIIMLVACSGISTLRDDADLSSNMSSKTIFDFLNVTEEHVGVIGLKPGMTQDEVIENLELNKENVKIFEPTADIESTRVYAQLDMECDEYPGFSWEVIFYFMDNSYVRAQLTASCYDIELSVVNQYVDDTVELISEHLDNSVIHASGDYDGTSQMNSLDSNCMVQWEVDGNVPITTNFALQDTSIRDEVEYDNVFSISFHVT